MSYIETRTVPNDLVHVPATLPIGDPLREDTTTIKWSGSSEVVPSLGSVVRVRINRMGEGIVVGYFTEYGWLGLLVELFNPPAWYVRQNGANTPAHIFGNEARITAARPLDDVHTAWEILAVLP